MAGLAPSSRPGCAKYLTHMQPSLLPHHEFTGGAVPTLLIYGGGAQGTQRLRRLSWASPLKSCNPVHRPLLGLPHFWGQKPGHFLRERNREQTEQSLASKGSAVFWIWGEGGEAELFPRAGLTPSEALVRSEKEDGGWQGGIHTI